MGILITNKMVTNNVDALRGLCKRAFACGLPQSPRSSAMTDILRSSSRALRWAVGPERGVAIQRATRATMPRMEPSA